MSNPYEKGLKGKPVQHPLNPFKPSKQERADHQRGKEERARRDDAERRLKRRK